MRGGQHDLAPAAHILGWSLTNLSSLPTDLPPCLVHLRPAFIHHPAFCPTYLEQFIPMACVWEWGKRGKGHRVKRSVESAALRTL